MLRAVYGTRENAFKTPFVYVFYLIERVNKRVTMYSFFVSMRLKIVQSFFFFYSEIFV